MAKELPFDEDTMTLIMGLGEPDKPGQHGRRTIPAPEQDAIDLVMNIRDMCEDFLKSAGKEDKEEKMEDSEEEPTDMKIDED